MGPANHSAPLAGVTERGAASSREPPSSYRRDDDDASFRFLALPERHLRLPRAGARTGRGAFPRRAGAAGYRGAEPARTQLSLIHISEPTRLGMISYAVF